MPTKKIRVVERTADLLNCLASAGGFAGVSELSQRLQLPKSTVHRILISLLDKDFATFNPQTGRYALGPAAMKLRPTPARQLDVRRVSQPYLVSLRDRTGETATLTFRVGIERMYVDQVESQHEIRMTVEIGRLLPLYPGAGGKAILPWLTPAEREQAFQDALARGAFAGREAWVTWLERVRTNGFATSASERVAGSTSVAAPVFNFQGEPIGAIGLSGPGNRFTQDVAAALGPVVRATADSITEQLAKEGTLLVERSTGAT